MAPLGTNNSEEATQFRKEWQAADKEDETATIMLPDAARQ
jgi:hypothetical protein